MAGPVLPNIAPAIAGAFDPRTGLPMRAKKKKVTLKEDTKRVLRIIDEQDAVNRYVWKNLPCDLTSQEVERMLYYKGQLCFFYNKELENFFFMPYALDGTIDFYGRFNTVHPIPMTNGVEEKSNTALSNYLSSIKLKCVYKPKKESTPEDITGSCVLLHDYSKQMSQTIIPRQMVNDCLLDAMADCVPFMRTNLLASSGIQGVRVADGDQKDSVQEGAESLEEAALTGEPWVPVIGPIDFQELTGGSVAKSEEYMLAMQSLDNLRLSTYGIENGGLFEKKAHELQSEANINGGPVGLVMEDGLAIRQNFCIIANSIYGTNIWCEKASVEQVFKEPLELDGEEDTKDDQEL